MHVVDNLNSEEDQQGYDNFPIDRNVFDSGCDKLTDVLKSKENWLGMPFT